MLASVVILAAVIAAYANSFDGVFVLDDLKAIVDNPSIRRLWPIGSVLDPPLAAVTVAGRPLLNLTLALNHAAGGIVPWGYHAVNLALHLINALLLLGILGRTFRLPMISENWKGLFGPRGLAAAIALFWAVHPLQTESVVYVVQRAESLVAFFYLLTIYAVIRAGGSDGPGPWTVVAVVGSMLGMASKEVMVTAPVLVLLVDRALLAGTFGGALRTRPLLHAGLAGSWVLLAYLVLSTGLLATLPDPEVPGWWEYARSQPAVILHYLRLSFWPASLCLYYDWPISEPASQFLPAMIGVGVGLALVTWGLIRNHAWALPGAAFFLILAPTSSVLPLRQLAFEHRMYLPLAAVITMALLAVNRLAADVAARRWLSPRQARGVGLALAAAATAAMVTATHRRNADYASETAIWRDTVAKAPHSALALNNLGQALAHEDRMDEAIDHFRKAITAKPAPAEAHNNLGLALTRSDRWDEAIHHYERALAIRPDLTEAHNNLGLARAHKGQWSEAIHHYETALAADPGSAEAHNNLGLALGQAGQWHEAIHHYEKALRSKPGFDKAYNNLGLALVELDRSQEAARHFQAALAINPDMEKAHYNLASMLVSEGRMKEGIAHLHAALHLKPDFAAAHNQLGLAMYRLNRRGEAIEHYRAALVIDPDLAEACNHLGLALADQGHTAQAIALYLRALGLQPDLAEAHNNLGMALASQGRLDRSVVHYEQALRINPELVQARHNLGGALAAGGRCDRAVDHFARAIDLDPNLAETHNSMGVCLFRLSRTAEALVHFREAIRINPGYAAARKNLQRVQGAGR